MNLFGSSSLGPVAIGLRSDIPSLGEIAEQANAQPGLLEVPPFVGPGAMADSFFDVWAEIQVGGQVLHPAGPLPLETVIAHKPPQDGERYVNPYLEPVELIDAATGMGTGIFIVREVHQPAPTVEHDIFTETRALVGLDVPSLGLISVVMSGPGAVDVYFEGPMEGDAVDDDFNNLVMQHTPGQPTVEMYYDSLGRIVFEYYTNDDDQSPTPGNVDTDIVYGQGGARDLRGDL